MVHGELLEIPGGYVGGVRKNERLGIPALNLEDGTHLFPCLSL